MKSIILIVLLIMGCAKSEYDIISGSNGKDGTDGKNGHSLVSQYLPATSLECDSSGGSRLDIYIDLDDSLTPSTNDRYQNSVVICNGLNGLNGLDGINGTNGKDGNNGHDGIAGPPGQAGPPGLNGNPGHDGVPGPQGQPGSPGAPGQDGKDGKDGAPGQDGKDAHVNPKNVNSSSCTQISSNYYAKVKSNTVEIFSTSSCSSSSKVFILDSSSSTFWLSSSELAVFVDPAGLRVLTYN